MKKQQNVETFSTLKLANEYETDLKNGLTEKEAKKSTQKNIITRAIGVGKTVKPDSFVFERKDFRYLMLCTDGLSNDLEKKDLHRILFEPEEILSFEKKVQFMVSLANERGGKDNITAYLIAL